MFGGPFWLLPAFLLTPVFMQAPYLFACWLTLSILRRKTTWLAGERPARIAGIAFLLSCLLHGILWLSMHGLSLTSGTGVSRSRLVGAPALFAALGFGIWLLVLVRRQRMLRLHAVNVFAFVLVFFFAIHMLSFLWAKQHLTGRSSGSLSAPAELQRYPS
jgi:hypothetical protein